MKQLLYTKARKQSDDFLDCFWGSKTLNEAFETAKDFTLSPEATVFVSGFHELRKISAARESSAHNTLETQLATLDNVKRALRKAHVMEIDRLGRSLPFLPLQVVQHPL